ncbi:unannotated protein [freshwater metagenome]|uniref:Unannotated protein n=1 Tax=freshwater metagenome TaxID=449393 RepID=A0A6J7KU15_9ZZZZ|nr:hypothetical protein [Actinomycetota bacterium]MSW37701.1 hypothetical protein [Actinomycetota bacterium]
MTRPHGAARARSAALVLAGLAISILGVGMFSTSASADTAKVWLTRASGAAVAENTQVRVGESLTVHVSGFNADATVLYQFGDGALAVQTTTDATGSGSAAVALPALKSDAYVLTASSDLASASFVVTLFNPLNPKVTPATSVGSTTSPTPVATSSSAAHPKRGLADTGGSTLALTVGGVAALLMGVVLMRAGIPVLMGRHEFGALAGRHQRR